MLRVQDGVSTDTTNVNPITYTYPAAVTPGNLLVISVGIEGDRTVSSVATSGTTTYSINGADSNNATATYHISQWKAIAAAGDTTVTITLSGAANPVHIGFAEFSGASSDQSGSTANGSTPSATANHGSGSVTPPTANNVIVASMVRTLTSEPGWSEDGAFTMVGAANTGYAFGYLLQSSATAQSFDATSVDNEYSAMRIGAFAGTAGGSLTTEYVAPCVVQATSAMIGRRYV